MHGAPAAATGAIAGAVVLIALKAIYDVPTALVAAATFGVLWRFKVPEPLVVLVAGGLGLIVWQFLKGG